MGLVFLSLARKGSTLTCVTRNLGLNRNRQNHGLYAVMIDGNAFSPDNGQAPDPGQFQTPLFISPPLNQSLHVVTLTNIGNTFVDIDFVRLSMFSVSSGFHS